MTPLETNTRCGISPLASTYAAYDRVFICWCICGGRVLSASNLCASNVSMAMRLQPSPVSYSGSCSAAHQLAHIFETGISFGFNCYDICVRRGARFSADRAGGDGAGDECSNIFEILAALLHRPNITPAFSLATPCRRGRSSARILLQILHQKVGPGPSYGSSRRSSYCFN